MDDPAWIATARKYVGQREIKGPHHNPHILEWWKDIGAPFKDDETAWCGAFVGGVLAETGIKPPPGAASSQAYLKMPVKLDRPAFGCVVVFWRNSPTSGLGHVGFVVGKDQHGNIMVLGGNQGDTVSIKPFALSGPNARIKGFRWPGIAPYPERYNLPLLNSDGTLSQNEA
ncbi:TIGR02594 family protein [Mesorhizobium sp. M2A.F.Ca.ET.039.01.1.1]|uniref:TIGR02594 family protein n=1 Tax=Mesorhizobium sp. M2A.F.Ca.ET.039.01.1.1 TaxID=2496746 RepID=UPI000FCCADF3|nr:TIGR02594 family protein [Mesorhizobium sp. M2A.F.Ca.ET.039.01.1.1]RWX72611.1 TIGR02594 family protein [Mesorhizobium sp. M2A.F.Ca.ET.039.01.1.1]